ncbi:MAG: amidohydrolase family protein [Sphingomonadales bacterium]|jgi:predicted TIM-barrel fold metal-dependent hydrolase
MIIDPDLPIIDPHHHLWDRRRAPAAGAHPFEQAIALSRLYLLEQLHADMTAGHNVVATVFVECGAFYRADGPPPLRPVGETEFVNGVAAMSASGLYGPARACAGIVGHADLTLGAGVRPVLEAHLAAAPARFRGIRHSPAWDADAQVLGPLQRNAPGLLANPAYRAGLAEMVALGLSWDCWLLAPQLPELIDVARAFPDLSIICDHVGTPLGVAAYAGQRDAGFAGWAADIRALAACPNVVMKLGGLAMPFAGFPSFMADPPASAQQLADEWRPWIETCIEAFGPARCMFESNFPVDRGTCDYATLWNAFKLLAAGASADDKAALFSETARRVYRLSF